MGVGAYVSLSMSLYPSVPKALFWDTVGHLMLTQKPRSMMRKGREGRWRGRKRGIQKTAKATQKFTNLTILVHQMFMYLVNYGIERHHRNRS